MIQQLWLLRRRGDRIIRNDLSIPAYVCVLDVRV